MEEINMYLAKEFNFLEENMMKAMQKQKAENSRFNEQCKQLKGISSELKEATEYLASHVNACEDHLGVNADQRNKSQMMNHTQNSSIYNINNRSGSFDPSSPTIPG